MSYDCIPYRAEMHGKPFNSRLMVDDNLEAHRQHVTCTLKQIGEGMDALFCSGT